MTRSFFKIVLAGALLLLLGCSSPTQTVVNLNGETMGTTYSVKFVDTDGVDAQALQKAIDERLKLVNALMSTYDTTSELSRFNQYRFTDQFEVSPQTLGVVKEAIRLGELSDGVLDVTVGPLVNLWGFGPLKRPNQIPNDQQVAQVREYVGLDKLRLTPTGLIKRHPMVYVDLSTIAKGYGVDEVASILDDNNIQNYLVEIGGEMRVTGHRGNGDPWYIAIEKPVSSQRAVQKVISIGTNAVATSGDYRNYYEADGVRYSHLIDPRTGKPISHNLVSVTVVHPSSMTADGLATAFNVMGWEQAIEVAERENLAILLIRKTQDGFEEYASPEFENIVEVHN